MAARAPPLHAAGCPLGRACTMAARAPPLHIRKQGGAEADGKLPGGYIDGSLLPRAARGPAGREP